MNAEEPQSKFPDKLHRLKRVEQVCCEIKSDVKHLKEDLAVISALQVSVENMQGTVQVLTQSSIGQERRQAQLSWCHCIPRCGKMVSSVQEDLVTKLESANRTMKLRDEQIARLEEQLEFKKADVLSLNAELYSYKQRRKGRTTPAEGNKYSKVQNEYERLFANTASKLVLGTEKPRETRRLLSHIFEVAYDECKTAVLLLICDDIYQKHTNLSDPEREALERKLQAFGDILLSNPLPDKAVHMDKIIDKLLKKVTGLPETLQEVKDEDASGRLREFMHKAVEVAWNMVTVQPPMVIDVQPNYNEEFHDPQHPLWDDDLLEGNYEMEYHRPTLFRSCMGELGGKGLVAMKDK